MDRNSWILELEGKPDFGTAMKRIYAWYEQEMIDRPPIRFLLIMKSLRLRRLSLQKPGRH